MAFDVWPVSLPQQILMDGNAYEFGDGNLKTQPDVGPPIVYPRTTAVCDRLLGHMWMTGAQITTLRTFGKTTILRWSLAFTFEDPFNAAADIVVMFAKPPGVINVSGDKYDVSMDLWVMPP